MGSQAATLSPGRTPASRSALCKRATSARSSPHERSRRRPSSPRNRIAGSSSSPWAIRFSAKLREESGKNRVSASRSPCTIAGPSPCSPITPHQSQAVDQKRPGSSTDQRCRSPYPPSTPATAWKSARRAEAVRVSEGCHTGSVTRRSVATPCRSGPGPRIGVVLTDSRILGNPLGCT